MPESRTSSAFNRVVAVAVLVALALYLALAWLHQFRLVPMAGGLQSPDMHMLGYDPAFVKEWIDALGRDGRLLFLQAHTFFLDLIFPPSFAFAAALLAWRAGTGLSWFDRMAALRRVVLVALAPAFYLGFDWSENMAVARMVADPMTINDAAAASASFRTVWKWVFVLVTLALPASLFFLRRPAREGA